MTFAFGMLAGAATATALYAALLLTHRLTVRDIQSHCDRLIDAASEPTGPPTPRRRSL